MGWLLHLVLISRFPYEKMERWGESLTPKPLAKQSWCLELARAFVVKSGSREKGGRFTMHSPFLSPVESRNPSREQTASVRRLQIPRPACLEPTCCAVFCVCTALSNREEARSQKPLACVCWGSQGWASRAGSHDSAEARRGGSPLWAPAPGFLGLRR